MPLQKYVIRKTRGFPCIKIEEQMCSVNNCKYSESANLYAFHGNNMVIHDELNKLYVL